jgi:hypothetical protein
MGSVPIFATVNPNRTVLGIAGWPGLTGIPAMLPEKNGLTRASWLLGLVAPDLASIGIVTRPHIKPPQYVHSQPSKI